MHKKNKFHCSELCDQLCFCKLINDHLSVLDHDFLINVDFSFWIFQSVLNYRLHLLMNQIHDDSFCNLCDHFDLIVIFVRKFRSKFCISMFFDDIQSHFLFVVNSAMAFACMMNIKKIILNVNQNIEKIENCLIFFHEIDKSRDELNFFIDNDFQKCKKLIV